MPRPRVLHLFLVAAFVGFGSLATAARAIDVARLIGQADDAAVVTVYLVPPMMLYRAALDEARMQEQSCRYATSEPAGIRAVVKLLKAANVETSAVYQSLDLREGVYLTMADGSQSTFVFQDNHGGRTPVLGVAGSSGGGIFQTTAVIANQNLSEDLREWAVQFGGVGSGPACARAVPLPLGPPK
jgi:hypothetical protein